MGLFNFARLKELNTISIKELKTKLRGYLDKISHGEKFIITEQGKEAAIMMPVPRERRVMHSLMKAKKAKWNGGKPAGIKGIRIKGANPYRGLFWRADIYHLGSIPAAAAAAAF